MNSCRCYCCCCWWRHHNHFSTLSIQFQIGGFNCFTSHIFYDFLWDLCLPFGHYLQRCIRNVALLCGMMVHIKSFLPKSWPPDWPSTIRCWIAQQQPQIVSKLLFDLDNAISWRWSNSRYNKRSILVWWLLTAICTVSACSSWWVVSMYLDYLFLD